MNRSRTALPLAVVLGLAVASSTLGAVPPWEAADLTPVTVLATPRHAPIPLVRGGQPVATLVIADTPPVLLRNAIDKLQLFFEKTTGTRLAVTNVVPDGPALVIGPCPQAAAVGLVPDKLPVEGFAIKTDGDKIFIVGHTNSPVNGTAWGVYDFAERYLGVRWFLPMPQTNGDDLGISVLPARDLTVPPVWIEDSPVFRVRVIWPDMSESWRGTGLNMGPLHRFLRAGNSWPVELAVHTPRWQKTAYTNERAEVFQLKQDGTRDFGVLCYSNPRTIESYLDQIQNAVDGKPYNLGIMGKTAITVSPADVELACYCAACQAAWDRQGGQYGTASKIMCAFVDKLAQEVEKRWPDRGFTVIFLPYLNYTACPDGVTFPGNVEVQICGMPGFAAYKEPSILAAEQANIDRWISASGRKIQNWHYSVWPAHKTKAAYQYPHVAKRFYLANRGKTIGSFINGEFNHWPRQHISLYTWLKCLWNPAFNVDAAADAFCARLFGPAAASMRELVGLQISCWEDSRWPDGRMSPKAIYDVSFPRDTVQRMEALFAKAREEARAAPLALARLDYLAPDLEAFFKESRDLAEGSGFKPLHLQKVGDGPAIDGKLDEPQWGRAQANAMIVAIGQEQGKQPKYPTTVRGLWTSDGVYFGFRMTEPTPDRLETRHGGHDNGGVWWDDNVEIFLDVTGKRAGDFYQIIVSASRAVFDNRNKDLAWEATGMKTGVFVGSDFWSLEVFLPFSALPDAVRPKPGAASTSFWTGNFTRHRVADCSIIPPPKTTLEGSTREYQRMNTTGSVTSDNLTDFAEIRFIE